MIRDLSLLRDQIVLLEASEGRHVHLSPRRYLAAARAVRAAVEREYGCLPIRDFVFPGLPVLQTMAENIYFDHHGCFADADGTGAAISAKHMANRAIRRAKRG